MLRLAAVVAVVMLAACAPKAEETAPAETTTPAVTDSATTTDSTTMTPDSTKADSTSALAPVKPM